MGPMPPVPRRAIPLVLALIAVLVFAGSLRNGLTNWDDDNYVTESPLILRLDPPGLRQIFTSVVYHTWAPATILSYAVDHAVFGMRPSGYHLTNVLLHALCTVLLYLLLCRILSPVDPGAAALPATFAAALFAIHPVQVESVAWVAERKNVLGMALLLGSFLAWLRATGERFRPPAYAACLLLLAGSLMAKSHAVILPPLLALYEWIERRPSGARGLRPAARAALLVPAFAVALGIGWLSVRVGDVKGLARLTGDLTGAFATAPSLVLGYVEDLLFPMNRSPILTAPVYRSPWTPVPLATGAVVVAWTLGVIAARRAHPHAAFFSLWFLGGLVPVLHFIPNTPLVADRYQYWAAPGLFALAALGFVSLRERADPEQRPTVTGLGLAVAGLLTAVTVATVPVWRSSLSLWNRAVRLSPAEPFGWTKLGETYLQLERLDDAEAALRKAVSLSPNFSTARSMLGLALIRKGFITDGTRLLGEAGTGGSRAAGVYARVWNNVGAEHFAKGRTQEALQAFERAVAFAPSAPRARANLGAAWLRVGNLAAAERNLREALRLDPGSATTRSNLSAALMMSGRLPEAERELRDVLRIDPRHRDATYNMVCLALKKGDRQDAFRWLDRLAALGYRDARALREDPDFAPLRDDPRFERLLDRMGRSSG